MGEGRFAGSETMSKISQNLEEVLFEAAVEKSSSAERTAFLDGVCRDDPALRARLEVLLEGHFGGAGFLRQTPRQVQPTVKGGTPRAEEAPAPVIGRYKLLEKIGEGGMGEVWMAEQSQPVRRRVAFKLIKVGMDSRSAVARFEAEGQALALMDHPNIARVYDVGATAAGRPYLVMELVRGVRITEYCDQNQTSTRDRLTLFIQVCQAVQHAHQKGIIHRDLKPSNILVTVNDDVPVPKVIDFGIAKAVAQKLTDKTLFTEFQALVGTPAYMSPEQAGLSSLDIDTRGDIYSLGVLLYELLVGRTPFDTAEMMRGGLDEMRRIIQEKEPAKPSTRLRTLPGLELTITAQRRRTDAVKLTHLLRGDLDWIVMKCLEKDRTRRYETANGLAADLKRHLNNEPVVARPPSTAYRLQKAWRRHKLVFTAAAVMAAALVVGTTVSSWQAIEASRARNAEKTQRLAAQKERDQARAERHKARAAQMAAESAQQAEKQARLRADAQKAQADHLLYAADMNLARQAWEQNNVGRLRQLLEDTQASPERGFEWYYWQREAHLALKTLRGHLGDVHSVAFSPDGQRIATGSDDRTAKVWEAASGRELLTLTGHRAWICSVAFSPDSQRIVTGSEDQTAKVWDAASGRELLTLKGHTDTIRSVAFSPDGRRIATGSGDKTAKVWETASGRELLTLEGHSGIVYSVAFSPDGQRIASGSRDQTAKVWEAATGKELFALRGHSDSVVSVAFSPDDRRIVTGSWDQTAKVWDAATGKELLTLRGHSDCVVSVAFSPDGQRIVTGSRDQTAKVWEAASGRELLTLRGHSDRICSAAFSPNGQWIVTGSEDRTAKVWEADSGREVPTLKGHTGNVRSVAFSPDGRRIVTGSEDQTAKVWEAASGRELLTLQGHTGPIRSVAFSPDGRRIVTGSWDCTAKVWDAAGGRELLTLEGHTGPVRAVAFCPDGRRIVTGSDDGTAKVWAAAGGKELLTLKGHTALIYSATFSPDGQIIVTGSQDQTAKVWEAASGRELRTLTGHSAGISSVGFSPDGLRIVTGSWDRTARVWEAATGRELLAPLTGHSAGISSVAFSPDGRRIVSGSYDQTARVWEAGSGRELLTLRGHSALISSVAYSADGRWIVSGSADQTAKVWEAAPAEQVTAWQEEERVAKEHLAAWQQQRTAEQERQRAARAHDEGTIKRWLILAPIPLAANQNGAQGLEAEQIEGEGRLQPAVGETNSIGNGELKWQEVALEDQVIDFNALLGQVTARSVAYAICYIRSEAEQRGLQMLVGSDDEAKVYLNGQPLYKSAVERSFIAGQDKVPDLSLNAGLNVLVFKVVNETGSWKGSVRLADSQGNPVKGIQVTLAAKDHP
jgi:WD40 repeat protein/serine/threonine protein kinase